MCTITEAFFQSNSHSRAFRVAAAAALAQTQLTRAEEDENLRHRVALKWRDFVKVGRNGGSGGGDGGGGDDQHSGE